MNYKKALELCQKRYKGRKRDKIYFKILKRIDRQYKNKLLRQHTGKP